MKNKYVIVIGASAGGTVVLPDLLRQLTAIMDFPIFVVLHLTRRSIGELIVKRLQKNTAFTCTIPRHREEIKARHVYLAPPDHHMMVKKDQIMISHGPMENRYRPSVDTLFRSAAAHFGQRVIGIVLSGMLEDGAAGMAAIRRSGGICVVQDPNEAQYPDMPQAVLSGLKPDVMMPTKEIAPAIDKLISKRKIKKARVPEDIIREAEIAEKVYVGIDRVEGLGEPSVFSCPDCGGRLWEIDHNGVSGYRCHAGHAYTEDSLLGNMEATTESALWIALRILEERRNLMKKMGDKEKQNGRNKMSQAFSKRSRELQSQIEHLRSLLISEKTK